MNIRLKILKPEQRPLLDETISLKVPRELKERTQELADELGPEAVAEIHRNVWDQTVSQLKRAK
jgi:predicted DNA-binding protein